MFVYRVCIRKGFFLVNNLNNFFGCDISFSNIMNRNRLAVISLGLYICMGIIAGFFLFQTFSQFLFLVYFPMIGIIEWLAFFFGYLRLRIRGELPLMKLFVFYCISAGFFILPLWVSVTIFDRTM